MLNSLNVVLIVFSMSAQCLRGKEPFQKQTSRQLQLKPACYTACSYLATREQQGPAGAGSPSSGAVLLPYLGLREPVVLWTSKAGVETQTKCKMHVVSGIRDTSRNIRVNKQFVLCTPLFRWSAKQTCNGISICCLFKFSQMAHKSLVKEIREKGSSLSKQLVILCVLGLANTFFFKAVFFFMQIVFHAIASPQISLGPWFNMDFECRFVSFHFVTHP